MDRFEIIAKRKAMNYPFLMGQGLYIGSEKLRPDDEVREIIKQGSMTAGFIGLAETLQVLVGKHHGESDEAQKLGISIVKYMNDYMDRVSTKLHLNFGVMGSPAEGCAGRLLRLTREKFGVIEHVTDRDYFTNSFHVPVYYPISVWDKINIEAVYHQYCPAGHISYIELDADVVKNLPALESIVDAMADAGMGYFAINHPVDRDPVCGYVGFFPNDTCPRCGRKDGEGVSVLKLLSLTSYSPDPKYAVNFSELEEDDVVPNNL
jgi:ribonucleoside-triphosphate reductase (formate)